LLRGPLELRQLIWAYNHSKETKRAQIPEIRELILKENMTDWLKKLPKWRKGETPLRNTPHYEEYFLELWGHSVYDEYWTRIGYSLQTHLNGFSDIPVIFQTGWFDIYTNSVTRAFVEWKKTKKSPTQLIIGPVYLITSPSRNIPFDVVDALKTGFYIRRRGVFW